jgi:hypothetical protein
MENGFCVVFFFLVVFVFDFQRVSTSVCLFFFDLYLYI